jgi:hypothetical protein
MDLRRGRLTTFRARGASKKRVPLLAPQIEHENDNDNDLTIAPTDTDTDTSLTPATSSAFQLRLPLALLVPSALSRSSGGV